MEDREGMGMEDYQTKIKRVHSVPGPTEGRHARMRAERRVAQMNKTHSIDSGVNTPHLSPRLAPPSAVETRPVSRLLTPAGTTKEEREEAQISVYAVAAGASWREAFAAATSVAEIGRLLDVAVEKMSDHVVAFSLPLDATIQLCREKKEAVGQEGWTTEVAVKFGALVKLLRDPPTPTPFPPPPQALSRKMSL